MEGISLLSVQIFFVLSNCFYQGAVVDLIHFEAISDKRIKADLNHHKELSFDYIHCVLLCLVHENCSTASFDENDQLCHLSKYHVSRQDYSDRLINVTSWMVLSKSECKKGWTSIGDSCYIFDEERRNMNESKNYCDQRGGKLAEPKTRASYDQLRSYLINNLDGDYYYFGLTDAMVEGKFVWISDGTVPVYKAWGPGEPNSGKLGQSDDNVFMEKSSGYRWSDIPPSRKGFPICEI